MRSIKTRPATGDGTGLQFSEGSETIPPMDPIPNPETPPPAADSSGTPSSPPAAVPPPETPPPGSPESSGTPPPPPTPASLPPPPPAPTPEEAPLPLALPSTRDERLWATLIHLSGILGSCFTYCMIPGHILVPLIIWLLKREGSPFLNDQGKECVNFQITLTIAAIPCFILFVVCVGVPMLICLAVYAVIIQIVAAIKANEGGLFRYPYIIRFLK
jgi:hypothetical protein